MTYRDLPIKSHQRVDVIWRNYFLLIQPEWYSQDHFMRKLSCIYDSTCSIVQRPPDWWSGQELMQQPSRWLRHVWALLLPSRHFCWFFANSETSSSWGLASTRPTRLWWGLKGGWSPDKHPTQWMVNNPDIAVVAPQVPDFTSLTCFSHFATGMTMDPKDFTRVPEVVCHQSFPSGHHGDVTSFYCNNLGISSPNSRYHIQVGCLQIPHSPTTCNYTV